MIGALVVRPTAGEPLFVWDKVRIDVFDSKYYLYGGNAGGGKTVLMHPKQKKFYDDLWIY